MGDLPPGGVITIYIQSCDTDKLEIQESPHHPGEGVKA